MKFIKVKTRALIPPKDNLYGVLDKIKNIKDGDVVAITSKVLAIHQGRCVKIGTVDKNKLIKQEADAYFWPKKYFSLGKFIFTIKDNTLIMSAGIDESNANGYYILWPKDTNKLLKEIWNYIKSKHRIKNLGVIATDSHIVPMRRGVVGIAIGFYGFEPQYNYVGQKDIFGRKLKYTKTNIVDALSAMFVLLMGEGRERIPIVILRGAKFVKFTSKATYRKLIMPPKKDIYSPLLKIFKKHYN